jgi:3-oxoacyl-[acyl-carrier-protein] synthase II
MADYSGDPKLAIKPFDKYRNGTVVSDGAALMVVESSKRAQKRDADPYCKIAGSSMTCEAYDIVHPHPQGLKMAKTIELAISDAKISVEKINHIQAHGTGTISNDLAETQAIKKVFGSHAYTVPITSIKSMIGHTIGAAGAFSVATAAIAYKKKRIPGTINIVNPDPDCDLDYVSDGSRKIDLNYTLCNSFALGGHNSCIVLGPLNEA